MSPEEREFSRGCRQINDEIMAKFDFDEMHWDDAPFEAVNEQMYRIAALKREFGIPLTPAEVQWTSGSGAAASSEEPDVVSAAG